MPVSTPTRSGIHRIAGWRWKPKPLGFDRLVAAGTPPGEFYGIEIFAGILLRDSPLRDITGRIKRERNNGVVVSVQAGDNGFNRSVFSIKGVHILRGLHSADKSAFDHVAAEIEQLITVSQSISICRSCFSGVVIHVSVQYNGTGISWCLNEDMNFPLPFRHMPVQFWICARSVKLLAFVPLLVWSLPMLKQLFLVWISSLRPPTPLLR